MYHIFCKKELIQKQKTPLIGYLVFTGKSTISTNTDIFSELLPNNTSLFRVKIKQYGHFQGTTTK